MTLTSSINSDNWNRINDVLGSNLRLNKSILLIINSLNLYTVIMVIDSKLLHKIVDESIMESGL